MTRTGPSFDHILALTDRFGTFEHAHLDEARREHGYCTDDIARVLVVAAREPDLPLELRRLVRTAYRFVADAQGPTGDTRNRRAATGRWHGRRTLDDCWGRSLWAFGVCVQRLEGWMAQDALTYFDRGAERRSPWPRAMAYGALGAAAVLEARPGHGRATAFLADAAEVIGPARPSGSWPWPEPRLSYANALLPDALLAAGAALERPELVADGLRLLGWLLDRETVDGHLSVTPAGGSGPGDDPGFDQQPIEVAAIADACARAADLTGDVRWIEGIRLADAWFDGANDAGAEMWNPATGGGFDGLEPGGTNRNQGCESTVALIATRQHACRLERVPA